MIQGNKNPSWKNRMKRAGRWLLGKWLYIILLLVISFLVSQAYYPSALPIFDRGHRLYGVTDLKSGEIVQRIFTQIGGLRKNTAFEAGPTLQVLFYDNTVICIPRHAPLPVQPLNLGHVSGRTGPFTSCSITTQNPMEAAQQAARWLIEGGFEAAVVTIEMDDLPNGSFSFLRSNAFENDRWMLVFRYPVVNPFGENLGPPPKAVPFP